MWRFSFPATSRATAQRLHSLARAQTFGQTKSIVTLESAPEAHRYRVAAELLEVPGHPMDTA